MTTIGFIGLGAMGLPMAKRLVLAGNSLKIAIHRNPEPALELKKLGASVAENFSEVVSQCDVIISILPADQQLRDIFMDPSILEAMTPGTLVIEMTTASPHIMCEVADRLESMGMRVLDAPVSGGVKGAADGTLTIMCGGEKEVHSDALPVLRVMGGKTPLVGGMGCGKALKAVNQMLVGINTVAVAEGLALARKLGIDLEVMRDVVMSSSGSSAAFGNKFASMVVKDYMPRFTTALMKKDMGIALQEAQGLDLPLAALAVRLYETLGPDEQYLDYSVIARHYDTL